MRSLEKVKTGKVGFKMKTESSLVSCEKGIINAGDDYRIRKCMERALSGEPVRLAFLGGSITQGSVASTPEKCYAYLTCQWWKEAFPKAEISYHNAGIGGTTSHLGVGRVEEDVLSHSPDFILVEFSVNDGNTIHFQETYEGLIRRILKADNAPALLLANNVRYDDGGNAEEMHTPVAVHYHLPQISMKSSIYAQVAAGKLEKRDITPDDLHPNDAGHALVAGVITHYLESIKKKAEAGIEDGVCRETKALPEPLTKNAYEKAVRYRNNAIFPLFANGFTADEAPQGCIADCFKKGWTAAKAGDRIVFEVEGSCIGVQYRKTIRRPAPVARLILDKDTDHATLLDANFTEEWGDCLYLETVMEHGKYGKHLIEIEIVEAQEDDKECFYLVSLIVA